MLEDKFVVWSVWFIFAVICFGFSGLWLDMLVWLNSEVNRCQEMNILQVAQKNIARDAAIADCKQQIQQAIKLGSGWARSAKNSSRLAWSLYLLVGKATLFRLKMKAKLLALTLCVRLAYLLQ